MKILDAILSRRRMILSAAVMMSLAGLVSWFHMPRQEDPQMPDYWGNIVALLPGADAETVERLLLEPMEDHLAEVKEISRFNAEASNGMALVDLELEAGTNTDDVWDDIREALDKAALEFPEGATRPDLNPNLSDQESIVLALSGDNDPLVLEHAAKKLRKQLLTLAEVSEVRLIGQPGEQVTIEFNDIQARQLGLDPAQVAHALASRSRIIPGGSVKLAGLAVNLRPQTDFQSLEEIRNTPIVLPGGSAVPLSEIAVVRQGPLEPARNLMRHNGKSSVGLGIIARKGVHLTDYGKAVQAFVASKSAEIAPLELEYIIFQPNRVQERLSNLGTSLVAGILIVAAVLLVFMGFRLGLVVAAVIPLVALSALAIYAMGGGMLQQISISALVIALGMLVDNAIVIAENVQWRIDLGEPPHEAAKNAIRELSLPLGSATATTLAAFVPMLISKGTTADFTRGLPIVIMLTLTISYLFAILVTPILSEMFLRKRSSDPDSSNKFSSRLAGFATGRPWLVLGLALVLVVVSLAGMGLVKQQFFPSTDRNQMIVDLALPEGAHLDATDELSITLERALLARPEVVNVSAFLGRSAPHFYYNLSTVPWSPHFGQLVVKTTDVASVPGLIRFTREFAREQLAGIEIVPRRLEQGPPVASPIEVRLFGEDLEELERTAGRVLAVMKDIPGTVNLRHDLSKGAPTLKFSIDDAAAARFGVTRSDVASTLYGKTRGLPVGQFRAGDDPVPVVVRSSAGEAFSVKDLEAVDVAPGGGQMVPLAQVSALDLEWRPAVIKHRDRIRTTSVFSELEQNVAFSEVLSQLSPQLETMTFPPGITWELGGQGEGSSEANSSMMVAMPVGLLLLFGILLAEFNSFRRVAIILVTVPLAAAGVVPGLLISGQPFGFMSFLGVIALVGVVVNNAIVLLDVIDSRIAEGSSIEQAVQDAIQRRTRPILLTTLTTVMGLLPLALSNSSLWPPLAWAMISGLLASTLLTLLVAPALFVVLFKPRKPGRASFMASAPVGAAMFLACLLLPGRLQAAETMTLEQVMTAAANQPQARAEAQMALAAEAEAESVRRSGRLPAVLGQGTFSYLNEVPSLETPQGSFKLGESTSSNLTLRVVQPILNLATQRHAFPAAQHRAAAQQHRVTWTQQALAAAAAADFLSVVALDAALDATNSYIHSLEQRLEETRARVEAGRSLETELLQIRLNLEAAGQERFSLQNRRELAIWQLGRVTGQTRGIEPDFNNRLPELPQLDQLLARRGTRQDLAALDEEIQGSMQQVRAISAERLPRLEAIADFSSIEGDAFRDGARWQVALQMSWTPFASGTRKPRIAAARYRAEALTEQRSEAEIQMNYEIRQAWTELKTALGAVDIARTGLELAGETARVQQERYRNGRVTINDLLEAEAALRQQENNLEQARIEAIGAGIKLKLATGDL